MKQQTQLEKLSRETCIVKGTHLGTGRRNGIAPGTTATRNLSYGRVTLEASDAPVAFENGGQETGFVCLIGSGSITTGGQSFALNRYDALYVPRDSNIEVAAGDSGFDLAEISAPVDNKYPLQFVSFDAIRENPALHFKAGTPPNERVINILLGKNIEAGRIMAGVTFSSDGNWTSFPPHEHANLLEEAYLYIDMPAPGWGIQMVYTDPQAPEIVEVVREGDVVVMPQGYHPNVAAPGGSINFLWMMAANNESVDRQFGVVNVQPEYDTGSSGLEASQK
jgi:5-deoxy-glucuronate isomerase